MEVTLPFMRSRMKQSLSGVWKAYVIHTMKGQSYGEGESKTWSFTIITIILILQAAGAGPELTPVLTNDSMILSLSARVSPCFILILFLSKHFMAYLTFRQHRLHISRHGVALPFSSYHSLFLTSFPCRPSGSRTPRRSHLCRWSDARWSHSWSAEEEQGSIMNFNRDRRGATLEPGLMSPLWFIAGWCPHRVSVQFEANSTIEK